MPDPGGPGPFGPDRRAPDPRVRGPRPLGTVERAVREGRRQQTEAERGMRAASAERLRELLDAPRALRLRSLDDPILTEADRQDLRERVLAELEQGSAIHRYLRATVRLWRERPATIATLVALAAWLLMALVNTAP